MLKKLKRSLAMIKESAREDMGGGKYNRMPVSTLSKYLRDSSLIVDMCHVWPTEINI